MKILLQSHWHPIDGDFYGLHDLEILIKVKCYISRIKHKSSVKVCTFTGKVTDSRVDTRLEVDTNPLGIAGRASGVKVSQIKRCGATSCVEPL